MINLVGKLREKVDLQVEFWLLEREGGGGRTAPDEYSMAATGGDSYNGRQQLEWSEGHVQQGWIRRGSSVYFFLSFFIKYTILR